MATPHPKKKKTHNTHTLSDLKTLGHQLLTSRCHVNNLPLLLTFVSPHTPPQLALEALLSLQSFITPLLPQLPSSCAASDPKDDPEVIYRAWVRAKFEELVDSLVDICVASQSDDTLRVPRGHANTLPLLTFVSPTSDPKDDPEVIYRTWVRAKFDELVGSLIGICVAPQTDDTLRARR